MAKQVINNSESGLVVRNKLNANFTELYDFDTALPAANQTLTNKTITDVATNKVNARAVAVYVKASAAFADSLIPRPFKITGNEGADAAFLVSPLTDNTTPANGIIVGALALNAYGTGYTNGKVYNVNTSLWNVGDILWLQTDGQLGTTKPSTGYQQPIAQVVRKNANTGILHVVAGYPVPDAADVRFTPAGNIAATDVQAALQELDNEKATAAQGALADSALQPTDIDTLAELNALLTDATLIDTNDSRLSDARTPLAHTHTHADITDYDTELAGKTNTTAFTPTADYHPATKKYVDDAIVSGGGYTDAQAQDAVGAILTDTAEIDFTYNAVAPKTITASLKAASIDETKLDASVNASLDLADSALQPAAIGVSVQAHSAILDATTASFTTADESKLDGIEAGADVTDFTNVQAAGAIMDGDFTANGIMKRTGAGTYATAVEDTDYQGVLAEGAFVDGDKTKLDGIAAGAEVNTIDSVTAGEPTGSDVVPNVVKISQANYDAASSGGLLVATTLYIIT